MSAVMANEKNTESSSSDDDSVSLLCNFHACQSRETPQDMVFTDLNTSAGNKDEIMEPEEHQFKPPESEASIPTQRASVCPNTTSQPAVSNFPNNINKRSETGETLLHKACRRGDVARLRLLIQQGICINAEDHAGWTALHEASVVGDVAAVEELLKAGADVHARSLDGTTPLHDAVMSGNCEVVKLLLQHGSNVADRNLAGLSAAEMTEEPDIKELLQGSSFMQQHHSISGVSSLETSSQRSVGCNGRAGERIRESCVRDGAAEPGDIQPPNKGTDADNSHSVAFAVFLEEVERKQAEISAVPLEGLQDADRCHSDLAHIQNLLIEVLEKQHVLKDNLVQKSRTAPGCLLKPLLKRDIVLLTTRQQTLVKIFQKQMDLVKAYIRVREKLSAQPSSCPIGRQQPDHRSTPAAASFNDYKPQVCNQSSQKPDDVVIPAPVIFKEHNAPAAASVTQRKKNVTRCNVLTEEANGHQGHSLNSGKPSECISFRRTAGNALIQGSTKDGSRHLSELMQRGLMSPGAVLRTRFKSCWHKANLQANGGIKDSRGKVHAVPELWLESILGKNIPVSSAYAWDKVTFRSKPLSHYLLNTEAAGPPPQTCSEDRGDVRHCQAGFPAPTESSTLRLVRDIRIIHLVNDDEMLPTALLERHWEKLLKDECEHW